MCRDTAGIFMRLCRGEAQAITGSGKRIQRLGDAIIDTVLEQADLAVSLAIEGNGAIHIIHPEAGEAFHERRADHPAEIIFGRKGVANLLERIPDRSLDPGKGIRQRAVKIEEDRSHALPPEPSSPS